jgi:hypothetical protein
VRRRIVKKAPQDRDDDRVVLVEIARRDPSQQLARLGQIAPGGEHAGEQQLVDPGRALAVTALE